MAALDELVPNAKTLYYVTQGGNYRCHNGYEGGRLERDVEKALLQEEFRFIDVFPTFGGDCSITIELIDKVWEKLD